MSWNRRWRPGGPTAQRSLITVAYNQYVDPPLEKFAAHVDTFNPGGPGLPPPDVHDHHGAAGYSMAAFRAVALSHGHHRPTADAGSYEFVFDFERAFRTSDA